MVKASGYEVILAFDNHYELLHRDALASITDLSKDQAWIYLNNPYGLLIKKTPTN